MAPRGWFRRFDALLNSLFNFWRWLPEAAPSERAFFEAFFTWVYTPRAHTDGSVDEIVEEALAFPHQQSVEAFHAQVDVCLSHDTVDRLSEIAVPTLVLSGEFDVLFPPRFGQAVPAGIPGALRIQRARVTRSSTRAAGGMFGVRQTCRCSKGQA